MPPSFRDPNEALGQEGPHGADDGDSQGQEHDEPGEYALTHADLVAEELEVEG